MSRPLFTASEAGIVMTCPASAALPYSYEVTAPQQAGSVMATFLASLEVMSREDALAAAPEDERAWLSTIEVDRLRPARGSWVAEVSFSLDLLSEEAHELGRNLGRGYARAVRERLGRDLRPTEVVGTADAIALADEGATVIVLDDKRGFAAHVPPARQAWQLLVLALAAARTYGATRARIGINRVLGSGFPKWDYAELDMLDLDGVAGELRELHGRILHARAEVAAGRQPVVTLSESCRYCKSLSHCPGHWALLRDLTEDSAETAGKLLPLPEDDDGCARIYDLWKRGKKLLDRLGQSLYARAAQQPFALTNGKWLLEQTKPGRPEYDARKVWELLSARYGRDVADRAVELSTSGTAVEQAVRPLAPPKGWTKFRAQLFAEIEQAGAVARPVKTRIDEVAATPEEVERILRDRHERRLAADAQEGAEMEARLRMSLDEAPPPGDGDAPAAPAAEAAVMDDAPNSF